VTSEKKLKVIKAVLNVEYEPEESDGSQHGPSLHRQQQQQQHTETFDEVGAAAAWAGPGGQQQRAGVAPA
jgi:hypothetical protein